MSKKYNNPTVTFPMYMKVGTTAPLDDRLVVETIADLTNGTIDYPYVGMVVSIGGKEDLYVLNALPATNSDNWKRIAGANEVLEKISGVQSESSNKISGVQSEMYSKIQGVQNQFNTEITNVNKKITGVQSEMNTKITGVQSQFNTEITNVNNQISGVQTQFNTEITNVNNKISGVQSQFNTEIEDVRKGAAQDLKGLQTELKNYTDETKRKILGGATDAFDTLIEVESWIETHGTQYSDLIKDLNSVRNRVLQMGAQAGPNIDVVGTPKVTATVNQDQSLLTFDYLKGNQGVQGTIGHQGFQGVQGARGADGVLGGDGVQGSIGEQGAQGTLGFQGVQGTQGSLGHQGNQGAQGTLGFQGVQGSQGTMGSQGVQGSIGHQGNQGVQGTLGNQGVQGTIGFQGVQGIKGDKGTVPSKTVIAPTITTTTHMITQYCDIAFITTSNTICNIGLNNISEQGKEIDVIVKCESACKVGVVDATGYKYPNGSRETVDVPAGGYAEINFLSDGTNYYVRIA